MRLSQSIGCTRVYINRDRNKVRRVSIEWYWQEAGISADRIRVVQGLTVLLQLTKHRRCEYGHSHDANGQEST